MNSNFPKNEVFLDTSYVIALSVKSDAWHYRAATIAADLKVKQTRMTTTRGVLLEMGNALSRPRYRSEAIKFLRQAEGDPNIEIVSLTDELYLRGLGLFQSRPDKQWGLVDCISFVVMSDRGLMQALTADEHFVQAGFRALLRE